MGATLIGERVGEIPGKVHGSTFGGNPLACAAALATIRTMEQDRLPERAAALGARMLEGFQAIDARIIRDIRGMGLMIGIELRARTGSYLAALAQEGVLALPAGSTVMRFLPSLVISEEDVDFVVEKVTKILTEG
jgi:acetylornithine/LysW-gamma-L-lysine aminotransferase